MFQGFADRLKWRLWAAFESAPLCPVAVPQICHSRSLVKFWPLPLLIARFVCHRQRSQTSPLRISLIWCNSVHHIYGAPFDAARATCCPNPLRIPHPKIDKLACQAQGVGILAKGEISLIDAYCTYLFLRSINATVVLYHNKRQKSIAFLKKVLQREKIFHHKNCFFIKVLNCSEICDIIYFV